MKSVVTALVVSVLSMATSVAHAKITYEGQIVKPDGTPMSGTVYLKLQVVSPGSESCVMYEESQDVVGTTDGYVTATLNGSGSTRLDTTGISFDGVFSNKTGTNHTFSAGVCASGNTYAPAASDGRKLVVFARGNAADPWEEFPAIAVNAVPYAKQAQQLAGHDVTELLRVPGQNLSPLSNAQYNALIALANGTSAAYEPSGVQAFARAAPPTCTGGQYVTSNGTSFSCSTPVGGGSLTSIAVNAPLSNSGTATAPIVGISPADAATDGYLSMTDWTTFNNKQDAIPYTPANKAGDSFTGFVTLHADPDSNMRAATKQYVDSLVNTSFAGNIAGALSVLKTNGGNNSAPSFTFSSDLDSGLYKHANDHVGIATGGEPRFTVSMTDAEFTASGTSHKVALARSNGSWASPTQVNTGDKLGSLVFRGYENGNGYFEGASFEAKADENWAGSGRGTSLSFRTTAMGSLASSERIRVTADGNVGIGATTPSALLHVGSNLTASTSLLVMGAGDFRAYNGGVAPALVLRNLYGTAGSGATLDFMHGAGFMGAQLTSLVTDASSGSESSALTFSTTNAGATSERVRIEPNGNVGIGTTTPLAGLDVDGKLGARSSISGYPTLKDGYGGRVHAIHGSGDWGVVAARATNDAGAANIALYHTRSVDASVPVALQNGDAIGRITFQGVSGGTLVNIGAQIQASVNGAVTSNVLPTDLTFWTAATGHADFLASNERMRITSGGNVGIGTNAPAAPMHVFTAGSAITRFETTGSAGNVQIHAGGQSGALNVSTTSFDVMAVGSIPLVLKTNSTEQMRIDSAGKVGIGTTSPMARFDIFDSNTATSALIVPRAATFSGTPVNGMVRYNTGSNLFEFRENGTWVNYTTVSDGRLKTNVEPVEDGLTLVNRLEPVFYDWDGKNPRTKSFAPGREVGFIAQDVEKVLPEVVNEGADGYRSLEYGKIVAVVVAAVKELSARVLGLDDEIQRLKSENDAQAKQLDVMKTYLCARDAQATFCK